MTMETESAATESGKGSNRLIILLDEIEKRVENLRKQALSLEKERGDLLECLHTVSQSEDAKCLSACELWVNIFHMVDSMNPSAF